MFSKKAPDTVVFYARLLLVLILIVLTAFLGLWVGRLSVPDDYALEGLGQSAQQLARNRGAEDGQAQPPGLEVPVYFHLGVLDSSTWDVLEHEISLAAATGIHQYIVPVDAPWSASGSLENSLEWLEKIIQVDPRAAFILQVNLNPPESWFEENPDEAVLLEEGPLPYPSPASDWWLLEAQESLTTTVGQLETYENQHRIQGVILAALDSGEWQIQGGFDRSAPNQHAFQTWLQRQYDGPESLAEAWGRDRLDFAGVSIPAAPEAAEDSEVFFDLDTDQPTIDYLRYNASLVADAIALLSSHLKQLVPRELQVLAPYGYTFEHTANSTGHLALGQLLESDLDGFVSSVSAVDRGLGGAGGMKGPISSAQYHGKQWFLIDDTRTPVARDPLTGDITRIPGIHNEDVFNVQRRNFALALVHGLGLAWADPQANGWLYEAAQWEVIGEMYDIYRHVHNRRLNGPHAGPDADRLDADETEVTRSDDQAESDTPAPEEERVYPLPDFTPDLLVVVDEDARFFQQNDAPLNRHLLTDMRDNLLRVGMKTQFCLMQDVLDGFAPNAKNYVFLNAFDLAAEEREKLHARLARNQATALWFYAPGYFDANTMDPAHVSQTVRMQVDRFEAPHPSGSSYLLPGRWIAQETEWGAEGSWYPMFYVDDPAADALAVYLDGEATSVAMRVLEEGWTSIYIAEPVAPPALLREIFVIMENPGYFKTTEAPLFDVLHASDSLLAVHASGTGDRALLLPEPSDITDLFDPTQGWMQRDNFVLSMRTGDTRLFQLE